MAKDDDVIKLLQGAAAKAADGSKKLPRAAEVVFLAAPSQHSPDEDWAMVMPDDVPADITTPETIGVLLVKNEQPMVAQSPTTQLWYRAFDMAEIEAVIARGEKQLADQGASDER